MNHKEGSTRYKDINNNTIKVPHFEFKTKAGSIIFKVLLNVTIAFVVVYVVGNVLSSPIINAAKYRNLLTVENRSFTDDIREVSYDQIPLLDKESASIIGTRVMGTMVDIVSYVLIAFAAISLVVSSVMISIITYVSVIERTKEIGILRSIGARKKDCLAKLRI